MPSQRMNLLNATHKSITDHAMSINARDNGYAEFMVGVEEARGYTEALASQITSAAAAHKLAISATVELGNMSFENGTVEFGISLGGLYRPSLNPGGGGIDDIVMLFTTGYSTSKRTPVGNWHGVRTKGLSSRQGQDIIRSVIQSFDAPGLVYKWINERY